MNLNDIAQELVSGLPVQLGYTPDSYLAMFCFKDEGEHLRFVGAMGIAPDSDFDHEEAKKVAAVLLCEAEERDITHVLTAHIGKNSLLIDAQRAIIANAHLCNSEPIGAVHTPRLGGGEPIVGVNLPDNEITIHTRQIPLEETLAWKEEKERDPDYAGPCPSASSDAFEEALKNEFFS